MQFTLNSFFVTQTTSIPYTGLSEKMTRKQSFICITGYNGPGFLSGWHNSTGDVKVAPTFELVTQTDKKKNVLNGSAWWELHFFRLDKDLIKTVKCHPSYRKFFILHTTFKFDCLLQWISNWPLLECIFETIVHTAILKLRKHLSHSQYSSVYNTLCSKRRKKKQPNNCNHYIDRSCWLWDAYTVNQIHVKGMTLGTSTLLCVSCHDLMHTV